MLDSQVSHFDCIPICRLVVAAFETRDRAVTSFRFVVVVGGLELVAGC